MELYFPIEMKTFCSNIIYSDDTIQSLNSVFCGYYVLAFLYWMTNKYQYKYQYNLQYTLNQFRSKFNNNTKKNDKILQSMIKKILSTHDI